MFNKYVDIDLNSHNITQLLNLDLPDRSKTHQRIIQNSIEVKKSHFNNIVFPIVPLYVSSICQENCKYCNFRVANKNINILRKRLTDEELKREVKFLAEKGFRVIELVYASDPLISSDDIIRHIKITKEVLFKKWGKGTVGINSKPYSTQEYSELKKEGLDFVVLWMETYDKEVYRKMHSAYAEKADYNYRYNAYERMLDVGIRNIGMGVLFGLSNFGKDINELFAHIDQLAQKYGDFNLILGIPRLKPAEGAEIKSTSHIPTDEEMETIVARYNIKYPFALPFLNTRESWDVNVNLARGGGVIFTFDCSTIPGGYSLGARGYQFPTYSFPVETYATKLAENLNTIGFPAKIEYDWNFEKITALKEMRKFKSNNKT